MTASLFSVPGLLKDLCIYTYLELPEAPSAPLDQSVRTPPVVLGSPGFPGHLPSPPFLEVPGDSRRSSRWRCHCLKGMSIYILAHILSLEVRQLSEAYGGPKSKVFYIHSGTPIPSYFVRAHCKSIGFIPNVYGHRHRGDAGHLPRFKILRIRSRSRNAFLDPELEQEPSKNLTAPHPRSLAINTRVCR